MIEIVKEPGGWVEREYIALDYTGQRELTHYKELATLRGELVSCLMSGNISRGAVLISEIEKLTQGASWPAPKILSADQKQNLRDALAKLTNAVNKIIID